MSKVKELIKQLTIQTFMQEEDTEVKGGKKQISLRPSVYTLAQIDTLADILDVSRQMMIDDLLDNGISDAIDAYCEAHGPKHAAEVREAFAKAFTERYEALNKGDNQ